MNNMHSADRPYIKALRKSEERHRLLLDALTLGVQENDCEGVITYSNRAHHQILGYEFGDIQGKMIWEFQPSDADQEALKKYLAYLVKEQPTPTPYITKCVSNDGSIVDLQIDWDYKRDSSGSLQGFVSVITDISDRIKAEESLRKRTQGLAILLDVSRSYVASLDLKNILQATVDGVAKLVGLNTAAVYLLENEMLHLWATTPPLPQDFPDELRIAVLADHPHIEQAVTTGQPQLIADMLKAQLSPAESSVRDQRNLRTVLYLPLIAGDKKMGALIVGSVGEPSSIGSAEIDLSLTLANLAALAVKNAQLFHEGRKYAVQLEKNLADRLQAEEERANLLAQLNQAQKLESVGRLAGGVAHDFNNMLNVILGHTEIALSQIQSNDLIYDDLQEIKRATDRSVNLTQQLLAFARKQVICPTVLNLNSTIASMLGMLRRLISEGIELEWLPGDSLWQVNMDPGQVDQILANLCVNARDSITDVGKVIIKTENAILGTASCTDRPGLSPGEYVMLVVRDNGCGMDKETQDKLFEPFFTTKAVGQGTGLGLATVYGIVKQNNGFIDVSSELEKGTTFKIYFPRSKKVPEVTSAAKWEDPLEKGEETLLIVEDEPALLKLGKRMLEMRGYNVLAAATPEEAIRLAAEFPGIIHLLVSDVVMPGMNGRELAKQLLSKHPDLKVMFMSGYTGNVIAHHGIVDEGVHFIQKPFSINELSLKVRQALDS